MTDGGADALSKAVCVEEVQPDQWQSITGHLPTQGHDASRRCAVLVSSGCSYVLQVCQLGVLS